MTSIVRGHCAAGGCGAGLALRHGATATAPPTRVATHGQRDADPEADLERRRGAAAMSAATYSLSTRGTPKDGDRYITGSVQRHVATGCAQQSGSAIMLLPPAIPGSPTWCGSRAAKRSSARTSAWFR